MKAATILILMTLVVVTPVHSKEFTVRLTAGDYNVIAEIERYPLVLGDNKLEVEIKDSTGKKVTDVEVLINYYMPPMPRMVPMNYKTQAGLKGDKYRATMNIIMSGPWYIKVIINNSGKISTAKFNVDAQ